MRLDQLQYLADVAQTRSMTETAERFFITRQAVSKNIKQLEHEMDVLLLERNVSGITLTEEGTLLVEFAQRALADFEQTCEKIYRIAGKQKQSYSIRICSSSILNSIVMPKLITYLPEYGKRWAVNITEGNPETTFEGIHQGTFDIGLVTLHSSYLAELLQEYDDLCCKVFIQDRLVACTNVGSSYAQQETIVAKGTDPTKRALFGSPPIKKYEKQALESCISYSNDVIFHKQLLQKKDVYTIMPNLAYLALFKDKKIITRPIQMDEKNEIIHGVICKKECLDEDLAAFIHLLEKMMQQR